ncbi:uncharacterized protein K452DRAFT_301558 [Aplosporella prunicola CBS 121167]|uniref:Uncharacterized protein n=1 Tax=Aplosporella prunicola CBS 121167 TaxID=1176127 RepID=A0A6A6B4E6_9PEZI|nr:uncharacterized protein K452DRAFT_301558 [Aplosporella prunicola CBS 121167]KAF2137827.1 hypothetical protein K452DRAFT_301558 [Aplosporella prunicola CBS 121167]
MPQLAQEAPALPETPDFRTVAYADIPPQRSGRTAPARVPLEQRAEKGMGSLPKTDPKITKTADNSAETPHFSSDPAQAPAQIPALTPPEQNPEKKVESVPNKGMASMEHSRWAISKEDLEAKANSPKPNRNMCKSRWARKDGQKGKKFQKK